MKTISNAQCIFVVMKGDISFLLRSAKPELSDLTELRDMLLD